MYAPSPNIKICVYIYSIAVVKIKMLYPAVMNLWIVLLSRWSRQQIGLLIWSWNEIQFHLIRTKVRGFSQSIQCKNECTSVLTECIFAVIPSVRCAHIIIISSFLNLKNNWVSVRIFSSRLFISQTQLFD